MTDVRMKFDKEQMRKGFRRCELIARKYPGASLAPSAGNPHVAWTWVPNFAPPAEVIGWGSRIFVLTTLKRDNADLVYDEGVFWHASDHLTEKE